MNTLVVYLLATFGFCYAVGHSRISLPFRELMAKVYVLSPVLALIECPACLGWWVGAAAAATGRVPYSFGYLDWGVWPFATCGAHYLLAAWTGWINERENE